MISENKSNRDFINFILLITVIVIFDVLGMQCMRYHNENNRIYFFYLSCFIYGVIISYLMLRSLKLTSVTTINFSWFVLGTLINIIIGMLMFGEKMNYMKLFGIVLAFTGAFIIFHAN